MGWLVKSSADFLRRGGVGQFVFDGPAADLGAVEREVVEAAGFKGDEVVGTGRGAGEAFLQQSKDGGGPGLGVVAAGSAGRPAGHLLLGAGRVVGRGPCIEPAAGESKFGGGLGGGQRVLPGSFPHMPDESGAWR